MNNIRDGRIYQDDVMRISSDIERKHTRTRLKGGEVLLTLVGTLGQCAVVPPELAGWNVARAVGVIPTLDEIDPRWIAICLRSANVQQLIRDWATTTVQATLNLRDVEKLPILVPPRPLREEIVNVISTLDDKIELNRQINHTLEQIAAALFTSWFVDFDPVRAKAAGRQPEGMDAATAALFPDRLVESELGEIPEGWTIGELIEAVEINPARSLRKGEEAPYLDMANVPTVGPRAINWINRAFGSGTRFLNGDTLMARITPCLENGKTAYVDFLQEGEVGWGSTEFIVMRSKPPLPPVWSYLLARDPAFRAFAIQSMTGTSGRQRVQSNALSQFKVVCPSGKVAERFGDIVNPLFDGIKANDEQSRTLAAMRDTLLPRLLSGELRVPLDVLKEEATTIPAPPTPDLVQSRF